MRGARVEVCQSCYNAGIGSCEERGGSGSGRWRCSGSLGALSRRTWSPIAAGNAAAGACRKCGQWRHALSLFEGTMRCAGVEANAVTYCARVIVHEQGGHWRQVSSLIGELWRTSLEHNEFCYTAGIRACDENGAWQQALLLLDEMPLARLEPNAVCLKAGIRSCER
ncbi:unnamed protein product, partial [Prorocentrum cordatum]